MVHLIYFHLSANSGTMCAAAHFESFSTCLGACNHLIQTHLLNKASGAALARTKTLKMTAQESVNYCYICFRDLAHRIPGALSPSHHSRDVSDRS